jgi:transposase
MKLQPSLTKKSSLRKMVLDAHPIIQHFIELLRIPDIIGSYIKSDKRLIVDVERVLTLVIHNYLTQPHPLYEFQDWVAPLDVEKIGLTDQERDAIQDDRIGKALESLYLGRHKDVFFRLTLRAIKVFELDCSQVHQDTTSITFCGKYPGWSAQEILTFGTNKDHRPDLKQLVLGMTVTADGSVPLTHRIYDGNQTDDRLHPENHRRLQKLLHRTDFIYVADCKLATHENLEKISRWVGLFVSVMPRTWKEDEQFRDKVRNGTIRWQHILSRPNNRKPDSKVDRYYKAPGDHTTSEGYRLYWIRSSQKAEQDRETRARRIQKALDELNALQSKLNKYKLKDHKQIKVRIRTLLRDNNCTDFIEFEINERRKYRKVRKKPGRPSKDTASRITWNKIFSITFGVKTDAISRERKVDGVFPLITNLPAEKYKAKRVLEIYKFQPFLEKRHTQIKSYQEVTPVNLKKSERVVAYLHMQVMSLMVATLIERKLRISMREKSLKSLPIYPEARECATPTMFDIVRLFKGVERYEIYEDDDIKIFPAALSGIQAKVLNLLGVPLSSYE